MITPRLNILHDWLESRKRKYSAENQVHLCSQPGENWTSLTHTSSSIFMQYQYSPIQKVWYIFEIMLIFEEQDDSTNHNLQKRINLLIQKTCSDWGCCLKLFIIIDLIMILKSGLLNPTEKCWRSNFEPAIIRANVLPINNFFVPWNQL